jgi:hypothetical protein
MLVSLHILRAGARRLVPGTLLILPLAACSGGDLALPEEPEDRVPVQLRAVSGSGQSALVGSPVPHPLVVEALNAAGDPVEGAVVVFRFVDPPNGAEIAPPVSATDPTGRAEVEVVLGTPAGDQPVEARLDDPLRDLIVQFLLTAIPSNTGGGDDDDDDPPPPPPDDDDGDEGGGGGGGDDDGGNGSPGGGGGGDDDNDGGGNGGGGNGGDGGDHEGDGNDDEGKGKGGDDNGGRDNGGDDNDDNSGRGNGDDREDDDEDDD